MEYDRFKDALDKMATNVMMADMSDTIVYANQAVLKMFSDNERSIQRDLPHFAADKLIGSSIHLFHKDPRHIHGLVADMPGTHKAEIHPGGLTFTFIANPLFDRNGKRMGTLVEWSDRSLPKLVMKIRRAIENVASSSREIARGNADLSQRTEEQAASLEETASSMEELTSATKQNESNARQANEFTIAARDVALSGGKVVQDVIDTMSAISASSAKISEIIGVIDSIAFQTNILALNAAVEAARAGEQGRGFAVVAGEVRVLAQRSASAAKEIKALIDDSVAKTQMGSKLVNSAGEKMNEIVDSVKRVAEIVGDITAASTEQAGGIEQVNIAVTQMDSVTQQNAALVEEAAAAAGSLDEQVKSLHDVVSAFKLDEEDEAAGAEPEGCPVQHVKAPAKRIHAVVTPKPKTHSSARVPVTTAAESDWEQF